MFFLHDYETVMEMRATTFSDGIIRRASEIVCITFACSTSGIEIKQKLRALNLRVCLVNVSPMPLFVLVNSKSNNK